MIAAPNRQIRWVVAVVSAVMLIASLTPAASAQGKPRDTRRAEEPGRSGEDPPPFVDNELLVRFDADATEAQRDHVRRRHRLTVIRSLPLDGLELVRVQDGRRDPERKADELTAEPTVRYADPNHIRTASSIPDDSFFDDLWGLHNTGQTGGTPDADIDAPEAWAVAPSSEQVVVGVIDTGIDVSHPDLAHAIWLNPEELPEPSAPDGDGILSALDYAADVTDLNENGALDAEDVLLTFADDHDGVGENAPLEDENGFVDDIVGWDTENSDHTVFDADDRAADTIHGTHVAGTVAGVADNGRGVAGVSGARIMALRFLGADGFGTDADAIEAIDYARTMKDRGVNVLLTNNSWGGGGQNQALRDAIAAAGEQLFVAAAGNGGSDQVGDDNDTTPHYPSSYDLDHIVAVAATDHNDALGSFSNYGAQSVDLAAPGVSILSTTPSHGRAVLSDDSVTGTGHVGFHSFGIEGIASASDRDAFVSEMLAWAGTPTSWGEPCAPMLLVDDDQSGATYETTWQAALDGLGHAYALHTVPNGGNPNDDVGPAASTMACYDTVIWFTGDTHGGSQSVPTLADADRTNLQTYLDAGGKVLLFGVDIAFDLHGSGGSARTFLEDTLNVSFLQDSDDRFRYEPTGIPPYQDSPAFAVSSANGGGGQLWADAIDARNGAEVALHAGYRSISGTSMATPHVSGAAAVTWAASPELDPVEMKHRLMDTGDPTSVLDGTTVSGKRLNLLNAVQDALPMHLDSTFAGDGRLTGPVGDPTQASVLFDVAIDGGGKVVVAGQSHEAGDRDALVSRLNDDGTPDTTFGGSGVVTIDVGSTLDTAEAVAVQDDGRIVVAGYTWNGANYDVVVIRLNADGSLDTGFDGDGIVELDGGSHDYGMDVTIAGDGTIVVVGNSKGGGTYDFLVARFAGTDGSLLSSTTTAVGTGTDFAYQAAVDGAGNILVAGAARNANNDTAVVRYDSDGNLDPTFGSGGLAVFDLASGRDDFATGLVLDGPIPVVSGVVHNGSDWDISLAGLAADGTGIEWATSTAVGAGNDTALGVGMDPQGRFLAAGSAQTSTGSDVALARYDVATDTWDRITRTFMGTGEGYGRALSVSGTRAVVAGTISNSDGGSDPGVVAYRSPG